MIKYISDLKILIILFLFLIICGATKAQKVQDFSLTSVTDKSTFNLSKSKGKYIALHFLLKTECPYCIRHTSEYFEKAGSLPNVIQVFIKPDSEDDIKAWANKLNTGSGNVFPIYQDKEASLANQFMIPSGYQFHGQIVHYPALVLLNPKGEEVFRYVGKNNTDRYSFDKLKVKIQELSSL